MVFHVVVDETIHGIRHTCPMSALKYGKFIGIPWMCTSVQICTQTGTHNYRCFHDTAGIHRVMTTTTVTAMLALPRLILVLLLLRVLVLVLALLPLQLVCSMSNTGTGTSTSTGTNIGTVCTTDWVATTGTSTTTGAVSTTIDN